MNQNTKEDASEGSKHWQGTTVTQRPVWFAELRLSESPITFEWDKMLLLDALRESLGMFRISLLGFDVLDDRAQLLLSGEQSAEVRIRHLMNAMLERWKLRLLHNGEADVFPDTCTRMVRVVRAATEADAMELLRFIHLTPVSEGYVHDPGDWWWSSYQSYRYRHEWEMLDVAPVLETLRRYDRRTVHLLSEFHRRGVASGNPVPLCLKGSMFEPLSRAFERSAS